jgi:hypothetical protein
MATLKPNRSRLREPCCQTVKEASPPLTAKEALGNKALKRSLRSDLFLMNVLGAD